MNHKILLIMSKIFGIFFIVSSVINIWVVLNGGVIKISKAPYIDAEYSGLGGLLYCAIWFIIGVRIYNSPNENNKKNEVNAIREEYSYCRWWINNGEWVSEENPQRKIKELPKDHVCPLCHKAIQIIDMR